MRIAKSRQQTPAVCRCIIVLALLLPSAAGAAGNIVVAKTDVTVTSAATLVLAINPVRATLSCTNTSASVHVRWGDATVTATKGQQLRAGLSIEIENSAPIYMISEGVDVTVSCTEETR